MTAMAEKSIASTIDWSIKKLIELASEYDSVVDIGCGSGNTIKRIKAKRRYGVDACELALLKASQRNNGVKFIKADLKDELYNSIPTVECIIGIDIIEHFNISDAVDLIKICELKATKCIMFFIPVGDHPQVRDDRGFNNHYYQTHRSTWYPKDLKKMGYEVYHYPNWHKNNILKEKGAMWCRKILA